jgi:hypothetical protein|tara:strand:- start:30 stop:650 length:621 start_codon:yes stop_codon:yes gene_type:complete
MLSSVTECFLCCITRPCRNKIVIENCSNIAVQYEAYIYQGATVSKIDGGVGAVGVDANLTMEIIRAEGLRPSVGRIQPKGKAIETCDYGGRISLRYKFEGLDWDYRPEIRNFGVLDKVQISPLSKEEIAYSMELLCKMEAAAALKIKTEELKKNIERKCSSLSQYMCSAVDTPKKQCPYCDEWYCNYHYDVNNGLIGGGHNCKGKT